MVLFSPTCSYLLFIKRNYHFAAIDVIYILHALVNLNNDNLSVSKELNYRAQEWVTQRVRLPPQQSILICLLSFSSGETSY